MQISDKKIYLTYIIVIMPFFLTNDFRELKI
jgi:hypothetical protein